MTADQFMALDGASKVKLLSSSHPIAKHEQQNTCSHYLQLAELYIEVVFNKIDPTSFGMVAFTEQDQRFDVMLTAMHAEGGSLLRQTA